LLSNERNSLLCQTSPGTQMGELLRRYWHPIAGAAEFEHQTVKPVRILGEDLALYRDKKTPCQVRSGRCALGLCYTATAGEHSG
jgi:phenylpropionate dioxygenase-like ring-hydroxylating dioxygenase large terminal subunit